jgi:GNAT superfamily N-acetyltransferase
MSGSEDEPAPISLSLFEFPLAGAPSVVTMRFAESLPSPWRHHAVRAVEHIPLAASRECITLLLGPGPSLVLGAWLSLPDRSLLPYTIRPAAFIHHVYVAHAVRRRGLGSTVSSAACRVAATAGFSRVLLSSSQSELRRGLYEPIGFRPVGPDQYLMSMDLHGADNVYVPPWRPHLRATGPYDLATVQSFCAAEHWLGTDGRWMSVPPEEVEEEFCASFEAHDTAQGSGHLATGTIDGARFVCWRTPEHGRVWIETGHSDRVVAARVDRNVCRGVGVFESSGDTRHKSVMDVLVQ